MVGTRAYPSTGPGNAASIAAGNSHSNTNGGDLVGTTITHSATPTITPKVGGKIALWAFLSGTGTAAQNVTASLLVNGVAIRHQVVQVSADGLWAVSMSAIDDNTGAGWPNGTPVPLAISATAAGALDVAATQAGMSWEELPLS